MTNLRFVITGGPGAGKTAILNALAEPGYICVSESARAIIRERLTSGLSPRPPLEQFGNDILHMDIARYREIRDDLAYGDLGFFGSPNTRTLRLDRIAAEGQKWTNFNV